MKVVTNQDAREGKNTIYRQILAAALRSIRAIGSVPEGKLRYYARTYWTPVDGVVGLVVYDRQVGKWIHVDSRFYIGDGDKTETRIIKLS